MTWTMVKAAELMVKRGGSVNPSKFPDETFELLSIPAYDSSTPEIIKGSEIGSSKSCIEPGDILLSKIVPHIRRCWVVPEKGEFRQIGSGEWIIFRDERFDPNFLKHFLTSDGFHKQFMNTVAGVGGSLVRARPAEVERIEIPLPPLEEQKRIAAILDKADAIRRKRQQAIKLADDFLRAVFLDMFGDPVTNPKGFEKVCLGHVCKIKGGKRIPKGEKLVKENTGYPYIKAGNIKNGKVNTNKLEYVPHQVREKIARYTVEAGDVCLTVVGANIGDVGIVPNELDNASLTENANKLLIQNKNIITNFYLASALQMDFIQNQIKSKTMAVGVPKLALFRIEQLEILIPPMELQRRFESIVNKVDDYLDRMATSGSFCDKPFYSLSQKAFVGEL